MTTKEAQELSEQIDNLYIHVITSMIFHLFEVIAIIILIVQVFK